MTTLSDFHSETIGDCTLYLGDCREILPLLPKVDGCITDPPYEERCQELHNATRLRRVDGGPARKRLTFNHVGDLRGPLLDAMVEKNQGWLLAFGNVEGVGEWQSATLQRGLKFKTTCIWHKPDSLPKLNGQGPAICFECFITAWCGSGHASWNGGGRRGMFTHCTNGLTRHGAHPTEKPIGLMSELVGLFSNHGQTILDPFMGSGTTGVACVKLGRKFIGIEIDPGYFEIACKRIRDAYAQPDLFIEAEKPKAEQLSIFEAAE